MSRPPPPEDGPTIPPLNTVDKILKFVDKPWKIVAVVIFVILGIAGWTVWENRGELFQRTFRAWVKPQMKPELFTPKFAQQLLDGTHADILVLSEISLSRNLIQNIDGFKRDTAGWRPQSNARPLFYAARDPQFLTNLLEGRPICYALIAGNEEEKALLALGMKRRCVIAVPPVLGELVGGLGLAWRQPLGPEAEAGATGLLYQAASELTDW